MQKHLSEHVRDLMRRARESSGFRFTATPVAPSKVKKIQAVAKEISPARKAGNSGVSGVKEKTVKIKLQTPKGGSKASPAVATKSPRGSTRKGQAAAVASPAKASTSRKNNRSEDTLPKPPTKRKRRSAAADIDGEDEAMAGLELSVAEEVTTVKDKWMKLYRDKYRAVDEARFRAIQNADLSPGDSDADQDFGTVAEEVVVTSEEALPSSSRDPPSLPDHDYNIYRVNRKAKAAATAAAEAVTLDGHGKRIQDEQMEAVAQSVAAAAQEKEKMKRKRGGQAVS